MNASVSKVDPDEPHPIEVDARASLVAQLVGPDPDQRREALRSARSRRWIDLYSEVVVRAMAVEGSLASRHDLEHSLSASGRGHTLVVHDDDVLLLVTSTHRTEVDIDAWARSLAARAGVQVVAPIGSARLDLDEDDLRRAADDARATTELLRLLGADTIGTTRAEDLGMWRLLHGMAGSPELVAAASPAADELWRSPDQTRRVTIEAYLDAGCSVAIACRALFIHRTTLYYRLESMPESVRDALADGLQRSTLHLGLKLLRLWQGTTARSAATHPAVDGNATITPLRPRHSSKRPPRTIPYVRERD